MCFLKETFFLLDNFKKIIYNKIIKLKKSIKKTVSLVLIKSINNKSKSQQKKSEGVVKISDNNFLKVADVAKMFNISSMAILNNVKKGKIKGIRIGGSWRIYANQFENMIGGDKDGD